MSPVGSLQTWGSIPSVRGQGWGFQEGRIILPSPPGGEWGQAGQGLEAGFVGLGVKCSPAEKVLDKHLND